MGKSLVDLRSELRLSLKDTDAAYWTDDELDHSIRRAVDDLSRHLPRESVYEEKLSFTVTAEAFTTAAAPSWVSLTYKPIKTDSVSVTNAAGTVTYTKDTDYLVDYSNGAIKYIAGGSMAASTAYKATYTKSKLGMDIGTLIPLASRIAKVEYPVGSVPQKFATFNIYGDFLYVQSKVTGESQGELSEDHIAIWYECAHAYPTDSDGGSYPALLDELVLLGASGYALMIRALEYEHDAATRLAAMQTSLADTAAAHVLVTTALNKVTTYLEDNTGEDAKTWLTNITTDIAGLRTALLTALDAAATNLGYVFSKSLDKATTGAEAYLDTGDGNIALVTVAPEVDRYAAYANARAGIANARATAVTQYIAEAETRLANIQTYLQQAEGWKGIATGFVEEASGRLRQIEQILAEAGMEAEDTQGGLVLSDRYRTEGQARLNEFESKLRAKNEYRRRVSSVSSRQPA